MIPLGPALEACEGVCDRGTNVDGRLGIGEETHTLVIENQTQAEAATRPLGSCTEETSIGIDVVNISGKDKCYPEEPEDGKLPCEEAPAEQNKGTCATIEDLSEFKRKDRFKGKGDVRGELASLVVETSAKKKNRKKCGSLGVKGKQGKQGALQWLEGTYCCPDYSNHRPHYRLAMRWRLSGKKSKCGDME